MRTEPLFSTLEHDIFFNRGVASSQAYTREFGNKKPNQLKGARRAAAKEWLSRQLDDAILKFIADAASGDALLCCFYEFRYQPVADALKTAVDRGVDVRLMVDAKHNKPKDKNGKVQEAFPRAESLAMIKKVGLPKARVFLREARTSAIHHNKFMVLLKGQQQSLAKVWTGSANMSDGGIHGRTNVGHWVRDAETAKKFQDYWELLESDTGAKEGEDRTTANAANREPRTAVEQILTPPESWPKV